jgi:hypothetical protein
MEHEEILMNLYKILIKLYKKSKGNKYSPYKINKIGDESSIPSWEVGIRAFMI